MNSTVEKANKLPDKKFELLRLAIEDFKKVLAAPKQYTADMDYWHFDGLSDSVPTCYVCLAGSVIAFSLEKPDPDDDDLDPDDFDDDTRNKLNALDELRRGNLGEVFGYVTLSEELADFPMWNDYFRNFEYDREVTYKEWDLEFQYWGELADLLEKHDL